MKKHDRDLDLLFELGSMRHLSRTWTQFLRGDVANLSDHIFRVVWTALIIAKYEGVTTTEKILKMALVHDVSESRTGDVHYLSREYTKRDEELAIKDVLKDTVLEEEFVALWVECEEKKTIEAQIVKDADNLDVDLELHEQPYSDPRLIDGMQRIRKEAVYPKLYTKTAKRLWKQIQTANPHDWHLKGRNRFNNGDWSKK
jgi:putative hydrolase of HD superfamily